MWLTLKTSPPPCTPPYSRHPPQTRILQLRHDEGHRDLSAYTWHPRGIPVVELGGPRINCLRGISTSNGTKSRVLAGKE